LNFLGKNKQAVVNTMGVYFVLSYSVYNYKVKLAWEEYQKDYEVLQSQLEGLKATITSDEFINQIETAVKSKAPLKLQLQTVVQENEARFRGQVDEVGSRQIESVADQLMIGDIGTKVADIGNSKSSGKII
jgi:hypothetical protein